MSASLATPIPCEDTPLEFSWNPWFKWFSGRKRWFQCSDSKTQARKCQKCWEILENQLFKDDSHGYLPIHANRAEIIDFKHGDFTKIASDVGSADIVTLDKVICCYDDMSELVRLSSKLSRKIYAVIYPRDVWWTKLALLFMNFYSIIMGSSFRVFIHPTKKVEEIIFRNGLKRDYYDTTLFWQVAIFTK